MFKIETLNVVTTTPNQILEALDSLIRSLGEDPENLSFNVTNGEIVFVESSFDFEVDSIPYEKWEWHKILYGHEVAELLAEGVSKGLIPKADYRFCW